MKEIVPVLFKFQIVPFSGFDRNHEEVERARSDEMSTREPAMETDLKLPSEELQGCRGQI